MIKSFRRTHQFFKSHPLGGRWRLISCWSRWLRWQLGSRLLPYPIEFQWIENAVLLMERGMVGATGNYYCGLHEFSDMALLLHYFGGEFPTTGFLDVGANVGSYTVLASGVCGVRSTSLEPVPSTFKNLERNIRANGIGCRVISKCLAAGSKQGCLRFSIDRDATNKIVDLDYEGSSAEVQVTPLDDLLNLNEDIPEFWKVDVEGFETEVLSGARNCLADKRVRVVLLEGDDGHITEVMETEGFQRVNYNPIERLIVSVRTNDKGLNNIWVRDLKEVQERCRAARRFNSLGVSF